MTDAPSTSAPPYSVLAEIYDTLMEDVDYDIWGDFIDEVIQHHHPHPQRVLELACGTGSLTMALHAYGCYRLTGTDKSEAMIRQAQQKAAGQKAAPQFRVMDFLDIHFDETFDIIVSIFDSINYLLSPENVRQALSEVRGVMDSNSLFIFDFTTPRNSREAISYLDDDAGQTVNQLSFRRRSRYNEDTQIHYNTFKISKSAGPSSPQQTWSEEHRQRAYSFSHMQHMVQSAGFRIVAAYDEFDLIPATDDSLRITMVLKCRNTP